MTPLSDTLQLLGQPLEDRHMNRRILNTSSQPDDVFRYVLAILWKSVVKPVIRQLGLEANFCITNFCSLSSSRAFAEIRYIKLEVVFHSTVRFSPHTCCGDA